MSENEFLRQKREREFQLRVLAALEKPRQRKLVSIINSGLFLWFLSAILITCAGALITNIHQCIIDADQTEDNFKTVSHELLLRRSAIDDAILAAKNVDDVKSAIANYHGFTYLKYKDSTVIELLSVLAKYESKIDQRTIPAMYRYFDPIHNDSVELGLIMAGRTPDDLKEPGLESLKKAARRSKDYDSLHLAFHHYWTFVPRCGLLDIIASLFTTKRNILEAHMPEATPAVAQ